ncbi:MAG: hypothetical protein WBF99_07445 [Xanthobacteraceae bacterium]
MNRTKPVARFGNSMRPAVLAALLIALTPGVVLPASAQANEEKPRWFGTSHGNTTMLAYGVPDSDYIMLSFSDGLPRPCRLNPRWEWPSRKTRSASHPSTGSRSRRLPPWRCSPHPAR